jgi:hypothetical protein
MSFVNQSAPTLISGILMLFVATSGTKQDGKIPVP